MSERVKTEKIIVIMLLTFSISACQGKRGNAFDEALHSFAAQGSVGSDRNPHLDRSCNACHIADISFLDEVAGGRAKGKRAVGKAKEMKGDLNMVCTACHAADDGDHAIGIVPKTNKHDLPLDSKGEMTCATTCHNVHLQPDADEEMKKGLLRMAPEKICFSCHDI